MIKLLKKDFNEIDEKLNFIQSSMEVVANSCAYNEDYAGENILRKAIEKNNDLIEKLFFITPNT